MTWDAVIVGGGCAGLAAATVLAEAGRRVLVLERRPLLGGRASSFVDPVGGETLDNGQHLFLGCYRETRRYLERIGSLADVVFDPGAAIVMAGPHGERASLRTLPLPAPFHLLGGVLGYRALPFRDRWSLLRVARAAWNDRDLSSISAAEWLFRLGQSRESRERFWDPLTLATVNIDPAAAPAELLATVLREGFLRSRSSSAVGIPRVGLSDLHGEPSRRFLEGRGGEVRIRANVRDLLLRGGRVQGVRLADGTEIDADSVISAVPPPQARSLVEGIPVLKSFLASSSALRPSSIVSLHLWLKEEPFAESFLGLWGREFHWVFRKSPRRLTLVKSSAGAFLAKGRRELEVLAAAELAPLSDTGQLLVERSVISVERGATWIPPVGNPSARPATRTPLPNFFLAGDWTATGLPATVESAVASGHRAAEASLTLPGPSATVA